MRNLLTGRQTFYFLGIGGVGMSALAKLAQHLGHAVRGSDARASVYTHMLTARGVAVDHGHHHDVPDATTCVVYSTAISSSNGQLAQARARGIPCVHRAVLLADFLNDATAVGITGTHGKTTTTLFTFELARAAGWEPTCLLGGMGGAGHDNFYPGRLDHVVAEVDESDRSLLAVTPSVSVLTNLEEEHVDTYPDLDVARGTVRAYLDGTRPPGAVVYWQDDPVLEELVRSYRGRSVAFGFSDRADVQAANLDIQLKGTTFDLRVGPAWFHKVFLPVAGRHNVQNLLAAVTALEALGLDLARGLAAVAGLATPARRLELLYRDCERLIVSDYAHHPTEVRAALESLRLFKLPLTLVFQPHRFSRLARFWPGFADQLSRADRVVVTDVYGAGEPRPVDHDCLVLAHAISQRGCRDVQFVPRHELEQYLLRQGWTGVVAFLGAGDIADIAHAVVGGWSERGERHADSASASVEA